MRELAKKIDMLERDFARADYILSEVVTALSIGKGTISEESLKWTIRNYQQYIKEKGRG
jgi:hypothetical protein